MTRKKSTSEAIQNMLDGKPITGEQLAEAVSDIANEMPEYFIFWDNQSFRIGRMRQDDILGRLNEWCEQNDVGAAGKESPVYLFLDKVLFLIREPVRRVTIPQSYCLKQIQEFRELMFAFGDPYAKISPGWVKTEVSWTQV